MRGIHRSLPGNRTESDSLVPATWVRTTRFLRNDFVTEIGRVLRPTDEIWMSEIFYAGGTTVKDISAADLIRDLKVMDKPAFFVEDRNKFLETVRPHLTENCVLLLMERAILRLKILPGRFGNNYKRIEIR